MPNEQNDQQRNVSHTPDTDEYLLAKTYFDCKEYYRAANVVKHATEGNPKAYFLHNYALFLAGEKRKSEERNEVGGAWPQFAFTSIDRCPVENRELKSLREQLQGLYEQKKLDAFLTYLYGVVLKELSCTNLAREVFAASLVLYPTNWSCWQELMSIVPDVNTVRWVHTVYTNVSLVNCHLLFLPPTGPTTFTWLPCIWNYKN